MKVHDAARIVRGSDPGALKVGAEGAIARNGGEHAHAGRRQCRADASQLLHRLRVKRNGVLALRLAHTDAHDQRPRVKVDVAPLDAAEFVAAKSGESGDEVDRAPRSALFEQPGQLVNGERAADATPILALVHLRHDLERVGRESARLNAPLRESDGGRAMLVDGSGTKAGVRCRVLSRDAPTLGERLKVLLHSDRVKVGEALRADPGNEPLQLRLFVADVNLALSDVAATVKVLGDVRGNGTLPVLGEPIDNAGRSLLRFGNQLLQALQARAPVGVERDDDTAIVERIVVRGAPLRGVRGLLEERSNALAGHRRFSIGLGLGRVRAERLAWRIPR